MIRVAEHSSGATVMYFVMKAVLRSLLLPPASPLLVVAFGALLVRRRPRFGATLLAVGFVSLWLFSTPLVGDVLSRRVEHYPALDLEKPTGAQAIVVIGGGGLRKFAPEFQGPTAENGLLERLSYAAFVARRTGLPILVSGAPEEAFTMQTSLARDFATPPTWVENQSRDTFENARFTAQVLPAGTRRIILITGSAHLWRAAHEFESAGFEVVPAPQGVWAPREMTALRFIPGIGGLQRSNAAIYEMLGEPMRRLQNALGIRERFDKRAAGLPAA
jgi:uncharacterized SAM-binding protein YcdF (DUF218 family)